MPLRAVVDAGPLIAWVDGDDVHHERVIDILSDGRYEFVIASLVLAEACYIIASRFGASREARLLEGLRIFPIEAPTSHDLQRMADLIRQYADFPLGAADASVVALAERFETPFVVTLDHRHFRAIRPLHAEALTLLP